MPLPDPKDLFRKMIDNLEEAASCARQLHFLREDQAGWLKVDEGLLTMRKHIIALYETAATKKIVEGRLN